MAQVRDARVAKRPGNQTAEAGKRRAPYALRACDACRRRKGKCDGRQPCRYCTGREQACSYDSFFGGDEWSQPPPPSVGRAEDRRPAKATNPSPSASSRSSQEAIMDMLSSLQGQLNSLASRVQSTSESPPEPTFSVDEQHDDDFLSNLINDAIALLIGLHADLSPTSPTKESIILDSIQLAVTTKLVAPVSNIKDVIVVLLKGSYDFFNDTPQSAWRMCGLAGRMLMELGFHNGAMSTHMLESRAQRTQVWALMSSIVILDRQWSAAAGLPTNFQESAFGPIQTSSIKTPYLEAMLSFIMLSDKISDPLAQAVRAQGYSDQEAFEVMNFRIERWRKRAALEPSLKSWHSSPLSQPPTWKVLLSLRAESVRSLLFKPHFFAKSDVQTSKQYLQPAIEVLFDVCNIMYNLNTTTDIYRKQQPFYQPLLASASGLGFVLTAFLEQNRSAVLASVPSEVAVAMGRSYEMAVALATGYSNTSKAAKGLSEKLAPVRASLLELGMLQRSQAGARNAGTGFRGDSDRRRSTNGGGELVQRSYMSESDAAMSTPHIDYSALMGSDAAGFDAHRSSEPTQDAEWEDLLGVGWATDNASHMNGVF
ncbi:hypothetical protein CkaCkLH20_02470 [Colletotrichum karsti]|uniref:Zn(2)-C6 fungal-type domain-containing protein n=1 Tax=Colletotrichum karsti TaxID=1095194 RepID=A0A9P6LKR0_9PEZI|nr:uncharacterized protein CkaCkLH20_02470 [Colletotrichum karsti]KAF9879659.1 hypothetical protein CkaCkLH20_02470 [Colletotrichum karsti]